MWLKPEYARADISPNSPDPDEDLYFVDGYTHFIETDKASSEEEAKKLSEAESKLALVEAVDKNVYMLTGHKVDYLDGPRLVAEKTIPDERGAFTSTVVLPKDALTPMTEAAVSILMG